MIGENGYKVFFFASPTRVWTLTSSVDTKRFSKADVVFIGQMLKGRLLLIMPFRTQA